MADKYVNATDLQEIATWGYDQFPAKSDFNTLSGTVDGLVQTGAEKNTIQTISVNNTPVSPDINRNVNVSVPTKTSDLTNDSTFQTQAQVTAAINSAVSSAYKYKGSVATVADLPSSDNVVGDVYDVQSTGVNYAWTGTAWDALGSYVDTSSFWTSQSGQSNTLVAMTVQEVRAILYPSSGT